MTFLQIERVAILPFADTLEYFKGDIFKDVLAPYLRSDTSGRFARLGRPAHCGDLFTVTTDGGKEQSQFEVCEMESKLGNINNGIIGYGTIIHCEGRPIERKERPVTRRYRLPYTELSPVEHNAMQAAVGKRLRDFQDISMQRN